MAVGKNIYTTPICGFKETFEGITTKIVKTING